MVVARDVAMWRKQLGLPDDPASDALWASRGGASSRDAWKALSAKADAFKQAPQAPQTAQAAHDAFMQSTGSTAAYNPTPIPTFQPAVPTPTGTNLGTPTRSGTMTVATQTPAGETVVTPGTAVNTANQQQATTGLTAQEVADLRASLGLPADPESDRIWQERTWATIEDVQSRLAEKSTLAEELKALFPQLEGSIGDLLNPLYHQVTGHGAHFEDASAERAAQQAALESAIAQIAGSLDASTEEYGSQIGALTGLLTREATAEKDRAGELSALLNSIGQQLGAGVDGLGDSFSQGLGALASSLGGDLEGLSGNLIQTLNDLGVSMVGANNGLAADLLGGFTGLDLSLTQGLEGIGDSIGGLGDLLGGGFGGLEGSIGGLGGALTDGLSGLTGSFNEGLAALTEQMLGQGTQFQNALTAQSQQSQQFMTDALNQQAAQFAPLVSGDIASLGEMRRQLDARFSRALAQTDADRGDAEAKFELMMSRMREQFDGLRENTMRQFADKGLARQPRFAGRAMRDIRDSEVRGQEDMEISRTGDLSALDRLVQELEIERDDGLSLIDADIARRRTALDSLLNGIGG